jgi:hypothetical protein
MTAARATLSVYIGRDRLGGIERLKAGGFKAYSATDQELGEFETMARACAAIGPGKAKRRRTASSAPRRRQRR